MNATDQILVNVLLSTFELNTNELVRKKKLNVKRKRSNFMKAVSGVQRTPGNEEKKFKTWV